MIRCIILLVLLVPNFVQAEVPKLFREDSYTCATLAEAINHYVALGEKATIKELESVDEIGSENDGRIEWVCRILFEPKAKSPLRQQTIGRRLLPRNSMPLSSWPLYPLVASGSTYFVFDAGILSSGIAESPRAYLKYCQTNGKFRTERVLVPTKAQALKDAELLRQSAAWKAIKWKHKEPGLSYYISEDSVWHGIKRQAEDIPAK